MNTPNPNPSSDAKPSDPFLITGPALISFSGGRTSAYMLWRILQAHGGTLPADVVVAFANTGKEREETLRFVHECETRWGTSVHWLEWRDKAGGQDAFDQVGFNSASRKGEPFAGLIAKKQYLPNAVTRFCTIELKIRVMRDFARSIGFDHWHNVIGLRYDEGGRVLRSQRQSDAGKERWRNLHPLADAKITVRDVKAFWDSQPFDLGLRHYEGNCDLCFLKGRAKLLTIMQEQPGTADWWVEQEQSRTSPFVTEYRYAELAAQARDQHRLPFDGADYDAECGLMCGGDSPAEIAALQAEFERRSAA